MKSEISDEFSGAVVKHEHTKISPLGWSRLRMVPSGLYNDKVRRKLLHAAAADIIRNRRFGLSPALCSDRCQLADKTRPGDRPARRNQADTDRQFAIESAPKVQRYQREEEANYSMPLA